jgi:hypothetical protein
MGQYTKAEIEVKFNDEVKAEEFGNIFKDFHGELSKRRIAKGLDTEFTVNINFVEVDDNFVRICLDSRRLANTEWQCDQISDIAKEEFRGFVIEFDARITSLQSYLCWGCEEAEK